MKIRVLFITLFVSALTGCGFLSKNPTPLPAATANTVAVDPKLLQACPDLPRILPQATLLEQAEHHIAVIGLYGTCAQQQEAGVKAIKSLANIKDQK